MNSLIIYDWDDTLFPTTYINHNRNINKQFLLALEQYNIRLLEKSRNLAQTIIITNAATEWIYMSAKQYMYRLYQYLQYTNIPVISAREYARSKQIYNPINWKDITFYNTINSLINLNGNKYINNIISVGDALYEKNALIKFGIYTHNKLNYNMYIKTIKYIDTPNIERLLYETQSLLNNIEYHVQIKQNLNITM